MSSAEAADREQQESAPATLALALLAFHRNVGPIRKQSEAKYGAFADLRTVLEAVTPPLLEQGLVLTQTLEPSADGSCLLHTTLSHAPSGERIASSCPIPSLQGLLERVHELRGQVLQRFPLDLPLAAIGALPPVLPPRNPEAGSELPPPPPRQPGLRLDDQLKGLYTLLGQLGTTTNPLHALGGTITYLRRYQILSLLCLAAEDDDGSGGGSDPRQVGTPQSPVAHTSQPHPQQPSAGPAPRSSGRARTSRSRAAQPPAPVHGQSEGPGPVISAAPRPAPTPPPEAAQPAPAGATVSSVPAAGETASAAVAAAEPGPIPEAADAPAAAPQAAALVEPASLDPSPAAEAAAPAGDNQLTPSEVQQLIAQIRTLPTETIPQLVAAFRQQFQLPASALVSDYIRSWDHAAFIRQQVSQLSPTAPIAA
ncbi:MAG: hypothetical protein VKM92_09835 [Cyanobacteriota bacterium]|nr:hypothetical protein [Cyanobacteriota bacterium]